MAVTTTTIDHLPAQPLPPVSKAEGATVTTWFVLCIVHAFILHHFLKRDRPAWGEFKDILLGTALLIM
jgi:hypothetical protein